MNYIKVELESIVYFVLRNKDQDHELVGRVDHIDEKGAEITRADKSPSPFSVESLPRQYKTLHTEQVDEDGNIIRFRVPFDAISGIVSENDESLVVFSASFPLHTGYLARATLIDQRGKPKHAFCRIIDEIRTPEGTAVVAQCLGVVPKAFSSFIQLKNGRNTLRTLVSNFDEWKITDIAEADRTSVDHYRKTYLSALEEITSNLRDLRREHVSAINQSKTHKGEKTWFGFTSENSFFGRDWNFNPLCLVPGEDFLTFIPGEQSVPPNPPKIKAVIYGSVTESADNQNNKHGRDKLMWLDATNYPGLDAFLGFVKGEIAREKTILQRTKNEDGKRTVFTDLLEGYFNPRVQNATLDWFKRQYLWMYNL